MTQLHPQRFCLLFWANVNMCVFSPCLPLPSSPSILFFVADSARLCFFFLLKKLTNTHTFFSSTIGVHFQLGLVSINGPHWQLKVKLKNFHYYFTQNLQHQARRKEKKKPTNISTSSLVTIARCCCCCNSSQSLTLFCSKVKLHAGPQVFLPPPICSVAGI